MSGFVNAPLTKALLYCFGINTVASTLFSYRPVLYVNPQLIQLWRPFTHQTFFRSGPQLLFGALLLYQLRIFERHWGSSKFGAYFVLSLVFGAAVQIVGVLLGLQSGPGPLTLLFGLLVQHYLDIPPLYEIKLFGVTGSDKIFINLLALQLLVQGDVMVPALGGIVFGLLYETLPVLKHFQLPKSVLGLFSRLLPLIATRPKRQEVQEGYQPTEQDINSLVMMGFSRERVIQVLKETQGNLEQAVQKLL